MLCVLITIQIILYASFFCYNLDPCDSDDGLMNNHLQHQSFIPNRHVVPTHPSAATITTNKLPILDNRTAVVVTLAHVSECEAVLLRHLVYTSGLEVWVLHGHEYLAKTEPELAKESEAIISEIPGLHSWPQSTWPISNFDSKVSKATKSSFLKFLIAHKQYDFAWHVESDVFFTGKWNQVLMTKDRQTDFLFTRAWNKTNDADWWGRVSKGGCEVDGEACKHIMPLQTYWMVARTSRPLATALIEALEKGHNTTGHHEGLLASFCAKRGFSTNKLDGSFIGDSFRAGNVVPWRERAAEKRTNTLARHGRVYANKMYHPVKCVAYTSPAVMQAEIDQWL
jgi:hypothetical protein